MKSIVSKQDSLIGKHPNRSFFSEWLRCENLPVENLKIHRKLSEVEGTRNFAIEQISEWIVRYHVSNSTLRNLKRKREIILKKYGFENYLRTIKKKLPSAESTKKGNGTEIILSEYLQSTTAFDPLIYRLRYNPNVNQSMKGDDVLLFNLKNLKERVVVGEAKFRQAPNKAVIEEVVNNIGRSFKAPLSILFVASVIDSSNEELADELEELNIDAEMGQVPIIDVGFLLSNTGASSVVTKHLESTNPNFVFVSLELDKPEELIAESFERAEEKIRKIIENEN